MNESNNDKGCAKARRFVIELSVSTGVRTNLERLDPLPTEGVAGPFPRDRYQPPRQCSSSPLRPSCLDPFRTSCEEDSLTIIIGCNMSEYNLMKSLTGIRYNG